MPRRFATLRRRVIVLLGVAVCSAILADACPDDPVWISRGKAGMVAADHAQASEIGAAVLRAGGNAFDAAVAVSFALTVCRPQSTGIGGGGFMLAFVAKEKRIVALDFREIAPASATPERYKRLSDEAKAAGRWSPSIFGGNAVGVPGLMAGLTEINRRFGTRPPGELIEPAIRLAEGGFLADQHYVDSCSDALVTFEKHPQLKVQCARLYEIVRGDGEPVEVGSTIRRPRLAQGLRIIARDGPDSVYRGAIGAAIVDAVRATGGEFSAHDLAKYAVAERTPLRTDFQWQPAHAPPERDFEIVLMPPPSSGGLCLLALCAVADRLPAFRCGLDPLSLHEHYLIEAMKHAFANRARWLGDGLPASTIDALSSAEYRERLWKRVRESSCVGPIESYGLSGVASNLVPDDGGTSHFCIADRDGNVVALTETINGNFGSFVIAEPYDIILNNQLDDFTTVPGEANLFGLQQSLANLIAPGKRPLSSMSPTIILEGGKPFLALGASGGPRIISSVLHVALLAMGGADLQAAMSGLRLHHQWQPDLVYFDRAPPAALVDELARRGHKISDERRSASVQAIQFLKDGTRVGASDPNKGGRPAAE